jgi:hypothetical protein
MFVLCRDEDWDIRPHAMLEAAAPTRQQFDEPSTSPVVVMRNPIAGPLVSSVTHHAASANNHLTATAAATTPQCPGTLHALVHLVTKHLCMPAMTQQLR